MARRQLALTSTLVVLALAGCMAPAAEPVGPAEAPPAEPGPLNLYLLDEARPYGTRVSGGAEPSIHATRDGTTLLIGDVSGLYRSTDGGATWTRAPDPFLPGLFADGWAIAEDDAGTLYVADTNGPVAGVAASFDNGATWAVQSKVVDVAPIADRPWLAARGDGEVALVLNVQRVDGPSESCSRSVDGGRTFLDRSLVNDARPNAGNAVYDSRGRIWFSDGVTLWRWQPCLAAPAPSPHPAGGPQIFTQVALDAEDRPYIASPSVDSSRMMLHGRGANGQWRSIAVSAPDLQSNTFGAISIDEATGEVAVAWYGTETPGNPSVDAFEGAWNVFVTRVDGFWTSSPTLTTDRLTTEPNHVGDFCMGGIGCSLGSADRDLLDYFGIDHGPDGALHVAYGHDGTGSASEVRYAMLPARS